MAKKKRRKEEKIFDSDLMEIITGVLLLSSTFILLFLILIKAIPSPYNIIIIFYLPFGFVIGLGKFLCGLTK